MSISNIFCICCHGYRPKVLSYHVCECAFFSFLSSFLYALHWKTHSVIHTCFFLDNTTSCQLKVIQGHHKVTSRTSQGHLILNHMLLFTHNQMCFSNVIIKCFVGKTMIISPIWQICSKRPKNSAVLSNSEHIDGKIGCYVTLFVR